MTPQLDDGDIYYQDEFIFNGVETTSELYPQLFTKISQHIPELFHNIKQKKASFIPQDHLKATYTKKINKIDGFLPWELIYHALKGNDYPMEKIKLLSLYNHFRNIPESNIRIPDFIYNAVRAFSPWPGIWTIIKVKNQKSKVKSDEKRMKILKVQLKNGGLVLDTVQLEGKNPVSFREFRNAYPQLFM
jgi:methionyl-tRNA formyltransferase